MFDAVSYLFDLSSITMYSDLLYMDTKGTEASIQSYKIVCNTNGSRDCMEFSIVGIKIFQVQNSVKNTCVRYTYEIPKLFVKPCLFDLCRRRSIMNIVLCSVQHSVVCCLPYNDDFTMW